MNAAQKLLDKVKVQMYLSQHPDSVFLTALMCSVKFQWDTQIATAQTNGIYLKISPDWWITLPPETHRFVLEHELWHIARQHPILGQDRHVEAYQFATDTIINNSLIRQGYTYAGLDFEPIFDLDYPEGTSEEEVYQDYLKKCNPPRLSVKTSDLNTQFDQNTLIEVQQIVTTALNAHTISQGATTVSIQAVISTLEAACESKVDWKTELQHIVQEVFEPERSMHKRNRRYPHVYMPGVSNVSQLGLETANFYVDVSGSVEDEQASQILGEIAEIYSLFPNSTFRVIQFDTEIQNEAVLENGEVPLIRIGYGGTSLEPVQEHIELHTPKLAVIFTDYDCIPMTELNSSGTTLIWVIVDSSEIPELGKTIRLNTY